MSANRAAGEPTISTEAAAGVLVEGLGELLRAQLSVANADVRKAAAVTEAVAGELDCMRKDVGSINLYCSDCEKKIAGTGGDPSLSAALSAVDSCHQETALLEEVLGQLEGQMAQLEERWGRLKR
ncbi:unnamed protein product [Hapterophycus canaliculatus]